MSQPNTAPTTGTNPAATEPTITPTPTPAPTPQPEPTPTPAPAAATPAPAPPAPTSAPAVELDDEDRADGVTADGDRVAVPQSSFRKLKDKAAERGRAKALAEMTERATALGFSSVDEMFAALERSKETAPVTTPANPNTPNTPPTTTTTPPAAATPAPAATPPPAAAPPAAAMAAAAAGDETPENDRRYSPEQRRRLKQAREEMQATVAQERRAREAAEAQIKAKDAELSTWRAEQGMREDLIRAGCVELDFTFSKLREHLASIKDDEAKLKEFDLAKWAEEQRKAKPFLFGAQVVPATTGNPPGAGNAPPAPNPADATKHAAGGQAKNAKDMSPAEWQAYKREHGLP